MEITYINGFISEACLRGLKDFEQVRDAIIVVKCEGVPFRGSPMDMARDAIVHILKVLCSLSIAKKEYRSRGLPYKMLM